MQAPMLAEYASAAILDQTRSVRHERSQEIRHLDIPDKTNSLAIFLAGGTQGKLPSQGAHFGLFQLTDWEMRSRNLFLSEKGQEIGLILGFVDPFQDVPGAI